jgi:glycosyltransferase involved in cell wall biosynthesis
MEAMACGTPVASTRIGLQYAVLVNGVNGYCNDVDDIDCLTHNVGTILNSSEAQWRVTLHAAFSIVENETWDRAVNQFEACLIG